MQVCRRIRAQLHETFVPILCLTADTSAGKRQASFEAGADAFLARPFSPQELQAQMQALLRIKERHDRLADKTAEMIHTNKRLQQAHQHLNHELELARRIQMSFLPQSMPDVPRAAFAVHYQPCGRVGGDFYDIFRLDENHTGFYVADAMGHGIPASLLTMFLKKGVRAKEIFHNDYRLVPPEEVLQRLNRDLIGQSLAENSFITMVYALLNTQTGTLQFSRAGHPHPIFLPRDKEPQIWKITGSLLGVFDTKFSKHVCQLQPGDKVLFYTDGTELFTYDGQPPGTDSFLACVVKHRDRTIGELVERVAEDFTRNAQKADDFTLLGLEVRE